MYAQFPAKSKLKHFDLGSDADYLAVLRLLLDAKANVNASESRDSRTPIYYAVNQGQVAAVDLLLGANADLAVRDRSARRRCTRSASWKRRRRSCRTSSRACSKPAPTRKPATRRAALPCTPRPTPAGWRWSTLLVEAGARVNAVGPHLCTPLQLAVQGSHGDVVEVLLREPRNLGLAEQLRHHRSASGRPAPVQDMARLLLDHGADVDAATGTPTMASPRFMISASLTADMDTLKLLLEQGANLNGR